MKNTRKFLLCFRPVDVDMEMIVDSKHARRPRTKLIENTNVEKLTKTEEEVQAPLTKTMSLDRDCSMIFTSHNSKPPRSRHSRTLAKVPKAVAFETTLAKKVRDGKAFRQHSLENERLLTTPASENTNSHEVRIKQSTKKHEESNKKSKKNKKGCCEFNCGMYLLLISLGVTVFWGRVFAILFTSIWLYFLSLRCVSSDLRRPENGRKWSEAELREERRVIMEGLIERSHHIQRGH